MADEHTKTEAGKVHCGKCNAEVTPKEDGTCPGCGSKVA